MILDKVYIVCRILGGSRGRNYDTRRKFLNGDFEMTNEKYITDYDKALSLVEFHFPDVLFNDKKIEVEYDIKNAVTNELIYNCVW